MVNVIAAPPDDAAVVPVPAAVVSVTAAVVAGAAAAVVAGAAAVSLVLPLLSLPQAAAMNASPTARAA